MSTLKPVPKLSLVAVLAVAFAALAAGPMLSDSDAYAQTSDGKTEIKIGALVQYTAAMDDTNNLRAMQLSVEDINADAGIHSEYVVSLVPIDITSQVTSGNLSSVVDPVLYNMGQGITHFIGPSDSVALGPIKLLADSIPNMVLISHGSSAPALPLPTGGAINLSEPDGVFRLVPSDAHQANRLTDLIMDDDKQKVVVVVRSEWEGIVNLLIPQSARHLIDSQILTYQGAETFLGDDAAAMAAHAGVANALNDRLATLAASSGGHDNVAVAFLGYSSDFEYHARAITQQGSGTYDNIYAVKWYGVSTLVGQPEVFRNAAVAEFAQMVDFTGTRYVVESNDVNTMLCDRIMQQGGTCDRFSYSTYASYDAVHLLVDAIVAEADLRNDNIAGNELSARQLILPIAAGDESHHLEHAGRTIGDGALGAYTLNAAGDLERPVTYVVLAARDGQWVPDTNDEIKIAFLSDFGHTEAFNYAVNAYNREQAAISTSSYQITGKVVETSRSAVIADIQQLESEGFKYFVGPLSSASAAVAKTYTDATDDIVLISPSSTAASLAIAGDSLFRLVPDDDKQVPVIMESIQGDDREHVVLIYRDEEWGVGLRNTITSDYANMITHEIAMIPDGANAASVAEQAAAQVADLVAANGADSVAVLHLSFPADTLALIPQITSDASMAATLGGVAWYGVDGVSQNNDVANNAAVAAFLASVDFKASQFEVPLNPISRMLDAQMFGDSGTYADNTYDAVFLLADSVIVNDEELSTNPASTVRSLILDVAGGLEGHEHHHAQRTVGDGALGAYTLNEAGDLISPLTYVLYELYPTTNGSHDWRIVVEPPARICR